ncbi:DrmE family protein [Phascolarctobacterium sp.]|uniref:DrmE family protein n=1 Tax=Phascolarctobacterium sp. TaxID=2049039 RepID=UPI0025DAA48C|nr:DrmE family protein [Phascolarctobacterium sp.]
MDSIRKAMNSIIEKCDVCIDGNVISKELLIKKFSDSISSTIEDKHHNIGIVLHTGSICFDAILLAYVAISNILYNKTDAANLIYSLHVGDVVLCYNGSKGKTKPSKWVFAGFVNSKDEPLQAVPGKYIVLQNDKNSRNYLPKSSWTKIVPYFGRSKSMDSRGLRHEDGKRYDFFTSVLEMQDTDIPRAIDTSTVIVMSRKEANELVRKLSFRFEETDIKLTDLVPVSYYTESNQEYQYGINQSKNEPVIKLTGKISVARKLLLCREGNRHIGLIVLGEDLYRRGESELPELLDRQSIQYIYLCMHLDTEFSANLIANYEEANLFACTKDFLLSNSRPPVVCNTYTEKIDAQIGAIINKKVAVNVISGFINWEKYKTFKRAIYSVTFSEYNSEQKDDFLVQAYSLMNLFMTAVFSIGLLEDLIESGIVDNIEKPELRLHRLEEIVKGFPDFLKEPATCVVSILEDAYLELHDSTPKETVFLKAIEARQGKIAVVVPKAYFGIVIDRFLSLHNLDNGKDICTMTANRFDNTQLYSAVIVVGNVYGKRFDALRCRSAQEIDLLLYECEKYRYKKQVRDAKTAEHLLNKRSTILIDDEYEEDLIGIDEDGLKEVDNINTEITDYISSATIKAIRNSFSGGDGKSMAEIVAVAKFDSNEIAFFTKNYKAYVLDEEDNLVKEVAVSDLSKGDVIVFTRSTSKTRDIVEEILRDMINNKLVSHEIENAYYKSREWKKTLIDHMKRTGSSAKAIADAMISNGVSVQEITIRGWLDEESHTVRPKKLDSIQQIALIAGNDELFYNAEVCFKAGGQIYKIRRQILKAIGRAILGEVTGNSDVTSMVTAAVADRIKDAAVTLQIETITFVDDEVPINTINRPITID